MSLLYYVFGLFVAGPFIEWWIHYNIHKPPPLVYHKNHHLAYYKKDPIYEIWVIPVIYFLYLLGCYIAALGFAKYTVVHNIIHYFPNLFPKLTRHHQILSRTIQNLARQKSDSLSFQTQTHYQS